MGEKQYVMCRCGHDRFRFWDTAPEPDWAGLHTTTAICQKCGTTCVGSVLTAKPESGKWAVVTPPILERAL